MQNQLVKKIHLLMTHIIQSIPMIAIEFNSSMLVRPKMLESPKKEEICDFDPRQYRYLLSVFADNVNSLIKSNKECLGEMEYYSKYRMSREESETYQEGLLDIYQKNSMKLLKESLYRNINIRKTREQHLKDYEKSFPEARLNNPQQSRQIPASLFFLRKVCPNDNKKVLTVSSYKSQAKRATESGSAQQRKSVVSHSFRIFQTEFSETLKLKTFYSEHSENKKCFVKSQRSVNSKNERMRIKSDHFPLRRMSKTPTEHLQDPQNGQQTSIKGKQILISHFNGNTHFENQWEYQKQVNFPSKFCTKRVVAIGQNQKKVINQIENLRAATKKENLLSKIGEYAAQLQIHQPPFKRWQQTFKY